MPSLQVPIVWEISSRNTLMTRRNLKRNPKRQRYCGFCGKHEKEIFRLIDGPTVAICNECIVLMYGMLGLPSQRGAITLDEFKKKKSGR